MQHSTILDSTGKPFKKQELTADPQTSRLASLHTEFENHPSRGLTPGKLARIMQGAEQGQMLDQCNLFSDIEEKDGHVFAEMGKRKRAVSGLEWMITAPRNATTAEQKATELAQEIIGDMTDLSDVILDMADAIGYAYSNLEMTWERWGNEWLPQKIDHRPPSWFTVLQTDRDQLRLRDNSLNGEELQPFTWISHVHKATSGFLPRAGLHRVLAWPFLFKNYSIRDLAEFNEIYGLPLRLGTYPSGSSDDEKSTLLRAVTNIGHNAAGIIPEGMMIEFEEAAKGGSDPYMAMINWCEKTQSKAILGGTLTSQADGASSTNALGNVHNEVRHDLKEADAKQIARTLTRDLVYPILALNSGAITSLRRCPRFEFITQQAEDIKLYSEAIPGLVSVGMRIPVKHMHERLQIPEADDDEEVLKMVPTQIKQGSEAPKSEPLMGMVALKGEADKEVNVIDELIPQLEDETQKPMTSMIDHIKALVDESESYEELQDKLLENYGDTDIEELTKIMAHGFSTAELMGMSIIDDQDAPINSK